MRIILKLTRKLENILEYYDETEDINDLISDIRDIIDKLYLGIFE